MALRKCTACAERVQFEATKCKHCGTELVPLPKRTSKVALVFAGLVAFIMLRSLWRFAEAREGVSQRPAESSVAAQDVPATVEKPISVNAVTLWRAYDKNEVAADEVYKGKRVALTGSVTSIDKDLFDHMVVALATGNSFESVHATLDESQKSRAMNLEKGEKISLTCRVQGRVMGSPMVADCVF